jgi:hypothetical protein
MSALQRHRWSLALCVASGLACGPAPSLTPPSGTLLVERQMDDGISGTFVSGDRVLEFSASRTSPFAGDVELRLAALGYDVHYDYEAGEVRTNGHGAGLDRAAHDLLLDAIGAIVKHLGAENPDLPLQEQMLYAGLVTWQQAGGMALAESQFTMQPREAEKSLNDDGVTCLQRGLTYLASFDHGDVTVLDRPITADEHECNGLCGPYCTQLTAFRMWTLDCLEHDACCRETDDNTCFTPLNACGDEYLEAQSDFLRGFDPFQSHCGG